MSPERVDAEYERAARLRAAIVWLSYGVDGRVDVNEAVDQAVALVTTALRDWRRECDSLRPFS